MTNLQITPIFIPAGDSGPMTDKDIKILIGIFIVLNMIWVASWVVEIIRYLIYVSNKSRNKNVYQYQYDAGVFTFACTLIMVVIWLVIAICALGNFIANLI